MLKPTYIYLFTHFVILIQTNNRKNMTQFSKTRKVQAKGNIIYAINRVQLLEIYTQTVGSLSTYNNVNFVGEPSTTLALILLQAHIKV